MRDVHQILRLSLEAGLSTRVVGERLGVGSTTVRDTLKRFVRLGLAGAGESRHVVEGAERDGDDHAALQRIGACPSAEYSDRSVRYS